jgi:alpha-D-xyloside xylohydrolase
MCHSGYPLLRALIFQHHRDKLCWHIDDQYYFGDTILVAPIMNGENRRDVYLPEGVWVNFFSGKITAGNCWLNAFECPLDEMPVWVKQGSAILVYPLAVSNTDEMDLSKAVYMKFDKSYTGIRTSPLSLIWDHTIPESDN